MKKQHILIAMALVAGLVLTMAQKSFAEDTPFLLSSLTAEQKAAMITEGKALIKTDDCFTCHRIDSKLTGPSYKDVAKRYAGKDDIVDTLANKVIKGGNKNWGFAMMKAHPNLSLENARKMVVAILSLHKGDAPAAK